MNLFWCCSPITEKLLIIFFADEARSVFISVAGLAEYNYQ